MLAMKFVNFDWHVSIIVHPKLQSNQTLCFTPSNNSKQA